MSTIELLDLSHTESFGKSLGQQAKAGDIITLEGDLGAGKTTLTQFIGQGLGVPESCYITSPTFSILHEYPGRLPLYHFDLYRISEEEIFELGFEDYFYGNGLSVIEWPDRLGSMMPEDRLRVQLQFLEGAGRRASLKQFGSKHSAWLKMFDKPVNP